MKRTWRFRCDARSYGRVLLVAMCLPAAAQSPSTAGDESARVLSLEHAWNQAKSHMMRLLSVRCLRRRLISRTMTDNL